MRPKVSVVMSNYNGVYLGLVIPSLKKILANTYTNLEVLLVDNASTDNSAEIIKKKFGKNQRLTIIKNPVNMYSQGLNLGVKQSSGEYVAFFNNDASVENGYFEKMIGFLEKHKKIGLAQGKLLSSDNPDLIDCIGETMDLYGNPQSIGSKEKAKGNYEEEMEILSVTGSCSILRKSIIKKVGYFDDAYGIGYEDMDFSLRARMQGYAIFYFPKAYVYHKRGATDLSPIVRIKVKWHFNKNRLTTIIKDYSVSDIWKALPVVCLLYTGAGLWEILIKRKTSLGLTRFTAIGWIIIHMPEILQKRKIIQKLRKQNTSKKINQLFLHKSMLQTMSEFITQ